MKKIIALCLLPLFAACSSKPAPQSQVPLDMKTVEEYNRRVASGDTVSPTAARDEATLNNSDRTPKVRVISAPPRIYPTIGVHHSRVRHNWGMHYGLGWGYY